MKIKNLIATFVPGLILTSLIILALSHPAPVRANIFVVEFADDDAQAHDANPGDGVCADLLASCTLRAAIEEANALSGWDTITFTSTMTITVDAANVGALPDITDQLTIDGSSVWDTANDIPGVTLNGGSQNMSGLVIRANQSEIYGLYIHHFNYHGVMASSNSNIIGDTGTGQRNVISGNGFNGVFIIGSGANNNVVRNNLIGVTPSGNAKEPNGNGVTIINGASNNVIGGVTAAQGNVIAGNTEYGVYIGGSGTDGNQLLSNSIGGATAVGNGKNGVYVHTNAGSTVIGGAGYGNTIAGNGQSGIRFSVLSGTTMVQANTIKENVGDGIASWGGDNVQVISNTIHNNTVSGIFVSGAISNTFSQNSIYDNGGKGIALSSGGNGGLAAPVISMAASTGAYGTACAGCWIELFSDAADEGKTYQATTMTDGGGRWFYLGALTGPNLTATAIGIVSGNTSEFSAPKAVVANAPPNTLANPSPANNATDVLFNLTLSWDGGDPDGDAVSYEVWGDVVTPRIGGEGRTGKIAATLWYSGTATTFDLSGLSANTKYSWAVTAYDGKGGMTQGASWTFTTGSSGYKLFLPAILKP